MDNQTLISVITPSFNQGEFIGQCLESVTRGGINEYEHIVVDGMSTDFTKKVVSQYPKIRFISEKDKGQSDAINKGIKLAKSEWIIWLNADDTLTRGALEKYVTAIEEKNANLFYGNYNLVDEDLRIIKKVYTVKYSRIFGLLGVFFPPSSGTLYKKRLFLESPLDEDFHYAMDTKWLIENSEKIVPCKIKGTILNFRVHNKSKTGGSIIDGSFEKRHLLEREICRNMSMEKMFGENWKNRNWQRLVFRGIVFPIYYYLKIVENLKGFCQGNPYEGIFF